MNPVIRFLTLLCFLMAVSIVVPPSSTFAEEEVIRISSAAGLSDAIKKIGERFTQTRPGVDLQYNFGASGALAKQIDNGAPADIFISANVKWMKHLIDTKKVQKESVRNIAGNKLVIVGLKAKSLSSLSEVTGYPRIAMGSPGSVPVGEYTEQALRAAGLYEALVSQKRLILTKDVRQALLYADRGEADLAFVYQTDALLAKHAKKIFTVPAELHDPITFNMALTVEGKAREGASAFFEFISSQEAMAIIGSYGFDVSIPPGQHK
jgi:molybdate transport system substrate-binding protein